MAAYLGGACSPDYIHGQVLFQAERFGQTHELRVHKENISITFQVKLPSWGGLILFVGGGWGGTPKNPRQVK
jgi:hypothetical protein